MPSMAHQYTKDLHDKLEFLATWPPGALLRLGDIGTVGSGREFIRLKSLASYGIPVVPINGGGSASMQYAGGGNVEFELKAAGNTSPFAPHVPIDSAGVGVNFKRENAVAFRADTVTYQLIDDLVKLREEIIKLIRAKRWEHNWSIVTQIATAKKTTALIGGSAGSGIELQAHGKVDGAGIELLSADAKLRTIAERDMQLAVVGLGDATPLFRAMKVRPRFFIFGDPVLRPSFDDGAFEASQSEDESPEAFFEPTGPEPEVKSPPTG
jgi:hypothetical protein